MSIAVLTAVAALAAVLGLILLVGRLARISGRLPTPGGGRLAVTEVLALDASRRLRLVRCDGREVLLLTGGPADVVVGWMGDDPPKSVIPRRVAGTGNGTIPRPPARHSRDEPNRHRDKRTGAPAAPPPSSSGSTRGSPTALSPHVAILGSSPRMTGNGESHPPIMPYPDAHGDEPGHDGICRDPRSQTTALRVALWFALLLLPLAAHAQSVNIDLGTAGEAGATGRLVQITALVTVLSLAPSLLVMMTGFTRIVIVLSLLRSALSTQGTPPNTVLIGLALFLTYFVMQPVLDQAWTAGIQPMIDGRIAEAEGLRLTAEPFRHFMLTNMRPGDLAFFEDLAHLPPAAPGQASWRAVVPAFMVGELRRAFEMGFLLFLPFLVIDMVVASVLMSLGMMMLPPSVVSLPFKLIFFVLVDGWRLVAGSLVRSFAGL